MRDFLSSVLLRVKFMTKHQNTVFRVGPNYSGWQSLFCLVGVISYSFLMVFGNSSVMAFALVFAILFVFMGAMKLPKAIEHYRFISKLIASTATCMTYSDLESSIKKSARSMDRWIGIGFIWEASQRQEVREFAVTNWHQHFQTTLNRAIAVRYIREHFLKFCLHPLDSKRTIERTASRVAQVPGYPWIHLIGEEKPLYLTKNDLAGHMAVFGTTGAGKSRFIEHQIAQAIAQGYRVIVLDPKGDHGLRQTMKEFSELVGRGMHFQSLHLGHPEESVHINLLANYSRPAELASRIAETLPGQGGEGQVFIDMGRGVLKTLCESMELVGEKPTFKKLYSYFLDSQPLGIKVLEAYLSPVIGEKAVRELCKSRTLEGKYVAMANAYRNLKSRSSEVDSILNLVERDKESLMKTTISTINLLARLVSSDVGDLLSPNNDKLEDVTFTDTRKLIEQNCVLYVGLDALTDASLARTIGSMFLADLAATAGARYNFEVSPTPVALFVDEAAELMCEPFIQMLNKSHGAQFTICLATQTVADFVAKAGDPAEAMRILANLNNFIALRCNDKETQEFLTARVLKTQVKSVMRSHDVSSTAQSFATQSGSLGERQVEQEAELVPAELLGALPNLEFFGVVSGGHVVKGRVPILLKDAREFKKEGS